MMVSIYRFQKSFSAALIKTITLILMLAIAASGCGPAGSTPGQPAPEDPSGLLPTNKALVPVAEAEATGLPVHGNSPIERPRYAPGEQVDYIAQTGDTLPGLAVRFNTSVAEILDANPFIPADATSMPPGMPMKIPIYYQPLWGSAYQIIPDSLFVNGPAQIGFDITTMIDGHPGWLKNVTGYVSGANRTAAEIVDMVASNYSISPRLLLALLEFQSGALTKPFAADGVEDFPLGFQGWDKKGLYLQLAHAANVLNDSFYRFRQNRLTELELKDGRLERIDPWQNAASAALHSYFSQLLDFDRYLQAISPDGLASVYWDLFGDPWLASPHIPGSLTQPVFLLPFDPGDVWALTGGPHTGWGSGEPLAAIDFAPPSKSSGCVTTDRWATAVADGVVVRSTVGEVMLDLDGDGDERTGWVVYYLHIATQGRVPLGARLKQGDRVGHPSCEGGEATGTHIHIARKYNGEWLPADGWDGILAFNLEGWTAHAGDQIYLGTLTRFSQIVTACTCSNAASWVKSDRAPIHTPTPESPAGNYEEAMANIRFVAEQPDLQLEFKEITSNPNSKTRKIIVFTDSKRNEYRVDFLTYQVIEFVRDKVPKGDSTSIGDGKTIPVDDLRVIARDFGVRHSFLFAQNAGRLVFSEMTKDGSTYAFRWEDPSTPDLTMRPFLQIVIGVDGSIIGYINTLDISTS